MPKTELLQVDVANIVPSGNNPRIINEQSASFIELTDNIRTMGVIVPVHIREHPRDKDKYELLAGERRLLAARKAGRDNIPAVSHGQISDEEAFEITFAENFAREDLTPLEQGRAVETLLIKYKGDAMAAASKMGKSVSWILQRKAINKNLSREWQKAITENLRFKDWTVSHLQLIAAMPQNIQAELFKEFAWDETPTVKELEKIITNSLRLLSKAPWNLDYGKLVAKVKACSKCVKRSSSQPGLFDDTTDVEMVRKNDRCLDAGCWQMKINAYLQKRAEELKATYPNLVFAARLDANIDYDEKRELTQNWPNIVFQWKSSKEDSKDALPALIVHGEKAGDLRWIRPIATVDHSGRSKPLGEDGKLAKKTLKQKQAELVNKRWCATLRVLIKAIAEAKDPVADEYGILNVMRLVAVFGTIENHKYGNDDCWKIFKQLSAADNSKDIATALERLWQQVIPVLADRLGYMGPITQLPEYYIEEAKHTSELLGIDIKAMFEEQVKAIPEPKSWAKEKTTGKKHKGKKAAKKDTPGVTGQIGFSIPEANTCRVCGCTEDNPCAGGCAWANKKKTLCTRCADKKD